MLSTSKTIGQQTTSKSLSVGPNLITGVLILTDGTNAATLTIYDNPSAASGTVIFKSVVAGATNSTYFVFPNPIKTLSGIYASISGTGASYIIYTG